MPYLETARLTIIPFTLDLLCAARQDPALVGQRLRMHVPVDWPGPDIAAAIPSFIRQLEPDPMQDALLHGDSRRLSAYDLLHVDFSITSPPYMSRGDPENPFTNYSTPGAGYDAYLADLRDIYRQLGVLLTDSAMAVVEVSNLKGPDGVTTLAWDIARAIGEVLRFEGEVVVGWEPTYGYGYDHSYCLLFKRFPG